MRGVKFILLFGLLSHIGCQTGNGQGAKATLAAEIQSLQGKLVKAEVVQKDKATAEAFVEKCETYVEQFPEDSLSAQYLFLAADVSRGLGEYGPAIMLWGKVWREYGQYEKAPDALFLQGFVYDNDLKDTTNAKRYYQKFLEKYPDHSYVPQVQQLLSVLGKSPEDLIKEFEARQKE
ncbi:MAG: tetratricopeptide repeat protein [Phaeodactylibacter sp.]|nr:tetratricopeptide repeat protein [Phaeodactylibacter sp.]